MDKETLSNYGWIVIAVLVLVVMIALATPFGSFVSEAVQSTTKGLFDVNKSALDSTGLINIDNQEFDVPDMNHGAGQSPVTPETPAEPQPTLIAFTIDGVSYQAEEGMTWEKWCDSSFNTAGAYIRTELQNAVYGFTTDDVYLVLNAEDPSGPITNKCFNWQAIVANGAYQWIDY